MRFSLGGPHVRLRVRLGQNVEATEVGESITAAAHRFFECYPSTPRYSNERIQEHNDFILAHDQSETDDTVYPNNSIRQASFVPETARYGGPDLVHHSFDFFGVSSIQTLESLTDGAASRSQLLSVGFRLLARQAWGFASDGDHLFELLRYPIEIEHLLSKADRVFEKQRDQLLALLSQELGILLDTPKEIEHSDLYLADAAQRLCWELHGLEERSRKRILASQMHMTANRLGFESAEETYLSRLVWRAARDLKERDPSLWKRLEDRLAERRLPEPRGGGELEDLLASKLQALGLPGPSAVSDASSAKNTTAELLRNGLD